MILSLFFTRGVSLEMWLNQGLFDREKLIYEEHLKQGNVTKVYWFSYGSDDKKLSEQLKQENRLHKDIEVVKMPKLFNIPKIGSFLYSFILPFIQKKYLKESDILKTNQMDGGWSVVIAKWLYCKPLIVRTGYTLSQLEYSKNKSSLRYKYYSLIETFTYKYCNKAIVSSNHNEKYLIEKIYLKKNNINTIKNFIDINRFKDLNIKRYEDKILFVGRLNKEKNLFNLIEAVSKNELTLDIYGQGDLKEELISFGKAKKAKINFKGTVPNKELVNIYNSYKYYILPSYFEGMPKTLLEAMACGCICIGTNVNGINEVIKDGVNGYLSDDVVADSLAETINKVIKLNNNDILNNGIKTIENNFSLKGAVKLENVIFKELIR
jgi:glycosyltransferase involved in cell wall biosynthesis